MTAYSKAHKRRAARESRKSLPRTPSGALSRSQERYEMEANQTEADVLSVVRSARRRVLGLVGDNDDITAPEAGSSIGRLHRSGLISVHHYRIANKWAEDVWRYHALVGIPHPSPRALDYSRVRGAGDDHSQDAVKSATNRYMGALGAIQQADGSGRPVESVMKRCIILDEDAENWPQHMVGLLKRGLHALDGYYGLGSGRAP